MNPSGVSFIFRWGCFLTQNRAQAVSDAGRRRCCRSRGLSLVEVMVSASILVLVSIGALAVMTKSYQLSAKARLSDNARAILRSYADQFIQIELPNDVDLAQSGLVAPQLFMVIPSGSDNTASFEVPIGSVATTGVVTARITRSMRFVNPATGAGSATAVSTNGGYLLEGTFTATYSLGGQDQSVSITAMHACVTK